MALSTALAPYYTQSPAILRARVARTPIVSPRTATIHSLAVVVVASAVRLAAVVAAFATDISSGRAGPGTGTTLAVAAIVIAVAIDATAVGVILASDEGVGGGERGSESEGEESEGREGEEEAGKLHFGFFFCSGRT